MQTPQLCVSCAFAHLNVNVLPWDARWHFFDFILFCDYISFLFVSPHPRVTIDVSFYAFTQCDPRLYSQLKYPRCARLQVNKWALGLFAPGLHLSADSYLLKVCAGALPLSLNVYRLAPLPLFYFPNLCLICLCVLLPSLPPPPLLPSSQESLFSLLYFACHGSFIPEGPTPPASSTPSTPVLPSSSSLLPSSSSLLPSSSSVLPSSTTTPAGEVDASSGEDNVEVRSV